MSFYGRLDAAWKRSGSMLCVGLDPDLGRMPAELRTMPNQGEQIERFCKAIVDATGDLVCAFKPQIAYFAAVGAEKQLEHICGYIRAKFPDVVLILDAKRGDIGDTATLYAREAFERYGADAVTVNPYLGTDSLEPFLKTPSKGTIVLCRTSNAGSSEFQSLRSDEEPLYLRVARTAAEKSRQIGECALVVGATFPNELAEVRRIVGDMPILVPGIGAQGGDVAAVVQAGCYGPPRRGLIINSSRAILYASDGADFADSARKVAIATRDAINSAR
ncbi:MAG: orotidine-5'-phosphate decarboxylase [Actinomycetota bacterium]